MTFPECYLQGLQCALRNTISDRNNDPWFSSKNQYIISENTDPTSTTFPFAGFLKILTIDFRSWTLLCLTRINAMINIM